MCVIIVYYEKLFFSKHVSDGFKYLITAVLLLKNINIENYVNIQNYGMKRNEITILSFGMSN